MFDPLNYGPRVGEILNLDGRGGRLMPLAAGTCSSAQARELLQSSSASDLFPGSRFITHMRCYAHHVKQSLRI